MFDFKKTIAVALCAVIAVFSASCSKNDGDKKNLKSEITKSSLKAYEKAFLYHQKQIKDFASSRNIGFLSVCSDNSVEKILLLKACEEGLVR